MNKPIEIIVEIGQNHNGDMQLAQEMIAAVADSGADVAKFQVYDAKSLFPKKGNPWFEYNCKTELSLDDVHLLNETCQKYGIEFMASVFDTERIQWLESIQTKRYKIASRSIKDITLKNALIQTNKPLIASLGMWDQKQFPDFPVNQTQFLYCVSKYPTELEDLHFNDVDFNQYDGFSDHTIGLTAPILAISRGAKIIEKHFTLDKSMYGPDHACSMTPEELTELCKYSKEFSQCL